MSPTHLKKHSTKTTKPKSPVAIANVFDEEEATPPTPRKPVVVEIEGTNGALQSQSEVLPPPTEISVDTPAKPVETAPVAPEVPAPVSSPWQAPQVTTPAESSSGSSEANVTQPSATPEPVLPSFFEHDLKGAPDSSAAPAAPLTTDVSAQPTTTGTPTLEGALPQAIVSEMSEGGDSKKKWIGIALIVLALLILLIGIFIIYAKKLSSPPATVTPTPLVTQPQATSKPVASATPVATQSGSLTATTSAEFKALQKKVKVDVLNGTKIAGLASKQASILKEAGYVTGRVGNGETANAGTIVTASSSAALVSDIQRILSDFTFKVTQDPKVTTVVVTLGEPK